MCSAVCIKNVTPHCFKLLLIVLKWDNHRVGQLSLVLQHRATVQINSNSFWFIQFFVQNGRGEDQFEVEPPEFDIEDVGVQVR